LDTQPADRVGESKERMMGEQHIRHTAELIRSPVMRALGHTAHKILMCIESELCHHGGKDNGRLPVTHEDFKKFGIYRHGINPGLREVEALGLMRITEHGRGGNAEYRRSKLVGLTYLPSGNNREIPATNEWKAIATFEEAKAIARKARASPKQFSAPKLGHGKKHFSAPKLGQVPAPKLGDHPPKIPKTSINPQPLKQGLLSRRASHLLGGEGAEAETPDLRRRGNGSWAGHDELLGQQLNLWPRALK
jgi:hypothetical protein